MISRSRWIASLLFLSFPIGVAGFVGTARAQEPQKHLPKRIVGDYTYWSKNQRPRYSHAEIPYHKLTHINHAGVSVSYTHLTLPTILRV